MIKKNYLITIFTVLIVGGSVLLYLNTSTPVDIAAIISSIAGLIGILSNLVKKEPSNKLKTASNHPVFSDFLEAKNELKVIDLGSKGRTALFKVMLEEQFDSYELGLRTLLDLKFQDSEDYRIKVKKLLLDIVNNYESRWIKAEIPAAVIERYRALQQDRIRILLAEIDRLAYYEDFESSNDHLFTQISFLIRLSTTDDALQALKDLNGTLKTLTFKGDPL